MNERSALTKLVHDRSQAKVTVCGLPDGGAGIARLFEVLESSRVSVDMIVFAGDALSAGLSNVTFSVSKSIAGRTVTAIDESKSSLKYSSVEYFGRIGLISLEGSGIRSDPRVSASLFQALAARDINVDIMSASQVRISVVVNYLLAEKALSALLDEFSLDVYDVIDPRGRQATYQRSPEPAHPMKR